MPMNPDPRLRAVLCSNDYAGVELVTLAQCNVDMFGHSAMADAINADQDLHTRLAARIWGRSYEETLAAVKAKDPLAVDLRQLAKPINFGLPGLMGPAKLVLTARKDGVRFCELSRTSEVCAKNERVTEYGKGRSVRTISPTCVVCLGLAEKYRDLWREEWPEMPDYHAVTVRIAEMGERGEPLESFGNGLLRLESNPNAVSNHFFQNRAAQGAKRAIYAIAKEAYTDRRSVLFNNCRPDLFVHDETMSELREVYATECGWRVAQVMQEHMQAMCPDVKVKVEPAIQRRWFKGADKKQDREGRLIPWWSVGAQCAQGKHVIPAGKTDCACWKWAPDQGRMWADVAAYA